MHIAGESTAHPIYVHDAPLSDNYLQEACRIEPGTIDNRGGGGKSVASQPIPSVVHGKDKWRERTLSTSWILSPLSSLLMQMEV